MSKETKDPSEKISPVEVARRLAREEREKREQQEGELRAKKTEQCRELKERLRKAREAWAGKRQELKEVQDGLNEIIDIEKGGIVSDELQQLRVELENSKKALEAKMREDDQAIQAMEADPLYAEMIAAEAAKKESSQKKEALEKIEREMKNLDTIILEISSAIAVAEKRREDIRLLQEKRQYLKEKMDNLEKSIETDIGGLLYALSEKQQRAIAKAVVEAKESGVTMYESRIGFHENHIVYRPSATTMTEWFGAWREKVTPSLFLL